MGEAPYKSAKEGGVGAYLCVFVFNPLHPIAAKCAREISCLLRLIAAKCARTSLLLLIMIAAPFWTYV